MDPTTTLFSPQVREWLFGGTTEWKRSLGAQKDEEFQKHRTQEEAKIDSKLAQTREDFLVALSGNRQQSAQIKASMLERKRDIRKQMKDIRVVMQNLFEQVEQQRMDREDANADYFSDD